jgi:glutathione synthase
MKKCAFFLDGWEKLTSPTDTSLYLIKLALKNQWQVYYFEQKTLHCIANQVFADVYSIHLNDEKNLVLGPPERSYALTKMQRIFIRKDPPFNLEYIYATYALELLEKQGVAMINRPQSLRDANEKFFILNFPACVVPTLVTSDMSKLHNFWLEHNEIILKPLDRMGGQNIFFVPKSGLNLPVILESLTSQGTVTIMAQKYIPEIQSKGDKRIILVNGEPLPYALARLPGAGDIRGNLCAGAEGKVVALSRRDYDLCAQVAPTLKLMGLVFVGIDVIGDFMTEINVTSPTGLVQIEAKFPDKNILYRLFSEVE